VNVGQPFICGTAGRRSRILLAAPDNTFYNGIDYLEVIDHAAPPGYPPQLTLVIKLFQPVPVTPVIGAEQIQITGGVRYPTIGIQSVEALTSMSLSADAHAYFDPRYPTLADQQRVLVVTTTSFGDFSEYTLTLVTSSSDASPLPGFDQILSSVDFSFKVECPSDFDCKPVDNCPPAIVPAPTIDYQAKDYSSFRRVILDRLSALSPSWIERNPADAGMVIAELLAYAGDQLSYFQDAVATEAYLGTARRRLSIRRHARLLDYYMHEGTNARAFVCFEIDSDVGPGGVLLPQFNGDGSSTIVMTKTSTQSVLPASQTALLALLATQTPTIFETMHDALLYPAHNEINFYTWDDEACCLPKGATTATLADTDGIAGPRLLLMPGDVLVFEEVLGHTVGVAPDPTRRQAVRLTSVTPSATRSIDAPGSPRTPGALVLDPLTGLAIVQIEWHVDDALTVPLCVTVPTQGLPVAVARGNAVLVDHGRTIGPEALSPATIATPKRYRPVLQKPEMTHAVPMLPTPTSLLAEPTSPAISVAATLAQDPHAAVPAVALAVGTDKWTAVQDLLGSDRFKAEFVVEMDEGGYAELRFGDGVLGRNPVEDLQATYRIGRGRGGNVGAETLVQVMTPVTGIVSLSNPIAAAGGIDPEPIDDVKQYAPQAFRVQERAVTEADYAACALRHPEVSRAVATRRWTGSWYTVFLTVERKYGKPVDQAFRDEIAAFIEQFRLAGEDLEIEPPVYVPLTVTLVVCCDDGYFREDVEQALIQAFSTGLTVNNTPAFFSPGQFAFGEPVYLSQVVAAAMAVPGVDWVNPLDPAFVFRRQYDVQTDEITLGYIAMGRLEIAQCETSPNEPEDGQISFILTGGQ
jgi:hypothetical protein